MSTLLFVSMGDDLNAGDVIMVDGEHHQILGPGEDEGDVITYRTLNLDGGDDDVILDPSEDYEVLDIS